MPERGKRTRDNEQPAAMGRWRMPSKDERPGFLNGELGLIDLGTLPLNSPANAAPTPRSHRALLMGSGVRTLVACIAGD